MCFSGKNIDLSIYADASHGIYADGKGHYGVVFMVGNEEVVRMSHKMKCVSLSSTESELVAAVDASTYLRWLIALFRELSIQIELPVTLHQDNQSTIRLTEPGYHHPSSRSKNFAVQYLDIWEAVESKEIHIVYLPTIDMIADLHTKPLQGRLFKKFRDILIGTS
jgi:hypothetical protein